MGTQSHFRNHAIRMRTRTVSAVAGNGQYGLEMGSSRDGSWLGDGLSPGLRPVSQRTQGTIVADKCWHGIKKEESVKCDLTVDVSVFDNTDPSRA